MSKKIRRRKEVAALPFPFQPTEKPTFTHLMGAVDHVLLLLQMLFKFQGAAVLVVLTAAQEAWKHVMIENEYPEDQLQDLEADARKYGAEFYAKSKEAREEKSNIVVPERSGLVGPDGNPL